MHFVIIFVSVLTVLAGPVQKGESVPCTHCYEVEYTKSLMLRSLYISTNTFK